MMNTEPHKATEAQMGGQQYGHSRGDNQPSQRNYRSDACAGPHAGMLSARRPRRVAKD